MLSKTTNRAFSQYQQNREGKLPRLFERLACIASLPNISASFVQTGKNQCRLNRDGVIITINPTSIEELTLRSGAGTKGDLPLAIADLIVLSHEIYRAVGFTSPDFFIEADTPSPRLRKARHFFNTVIDDYAIDIHLRNIPLFRRYFDAFVSRLLPHDERNMPQHVQFLNMLGIMLLESNPVMLFDSEVGDAIVSIDTKLKIKGTSLASVFRHEHSYAERHRLANECIFPVYKAFFESDRARFDRYLMDQSYDDEMLYGKIDRPSLQELQNAKTQDMSEYIEELFVVTDSHLQNEVIESFIDASTAAERGDADDAPGLMLPRSGEATEEFKLHEDTMAGYYTLINRWHLVIKKVADVLLKLATPKESIAVPRYRTIASHEGIRINPRTMPQAYIQLETGYHLPIWQSVERVVRQQDVRFCGLDIYLLLDVSGSMGGENAHYAAAMALCLIEGLQLARSRADLDQKQGQVDVRTQLLAFGSGWAELTSLCREPRQAQKELAYYNLMHPSSNFTQINGALRHVRSNAAKYSERDVLCLIISDGLFSDNQAAFKTVRTMPKNVYVGHINIGNSMGIPITLHYESVYDPRVLPKKLQLILEEYFESISQRFI